MKRIKEFETLLVEKLQAVTYKQADKLNELGFDWETNLFYNSIEEMVCIPDNYQNWNSPKWKFDGRISAPTVALALEWIRSEKGIACTVRAWSNWKYGWEYYSGNHWHSSLCGEYDKHCEADNALLDELLDYLLEK